LPRHPRNFIPGNPRQNRCRSQTHIHLLVASIPRYQLIKPFRGARFQPVVKKRLIKTDVRTGCSGSSIHVSAARKFLKNKHITPQSLQLLPRYHGPTDRRNQAGRNFWRGCLILPSRLLEMPFRKFLRELAAFEPELQLQGQRRSVPKGREPRKRQGSTRLFASQLKALRIKSVRTNIAR
jgi:hypothetical protein